MPPHTNPLSGRFFSDKHKYLFSLQCCTIAITAFRALSGISGRNASKPFFSLTTSGWITDTFGARWMLALYVVSWSLATIGLGWAQGLATIWAMRLILGIMQAKGAKTLVKGQQAPAICWPLATTASAVPRRV